MWNMASQGYCNHGRIRELTNQAIKEKVGEDGFTIFKLNDTCHPGAIEGSLRTLDF